MNLRELVKLLLPPIVADGIRRVAPSVSAPIFEFEPDGFRGAAMQSGVTSWDIEDISRAEREKWAGYIRNLEGTGPLGFAHEHSDPGETANIAFHNIHLTYAYVLALAAHKRDRLSVLDWGGSLGHYHALGRAVLPEVALDFHCHEVPVLAETGRGVNPDVHWCDTDECLQRRYDLVMINSSLQYVEAWRPQLQAIAGAAADYLFLSRLPVVQRHPGFVVTQRVYGTRIPQHHFNQRELVDTVVDCGFRLLREFVYGPCPVSRNTPEQCEQRGWLFRRIAA